MLMVRSLMILVFIFASQLCIASFDSKDELIDSIHRAGFNQVISLGTHDLSGFKVYAEGFSSPLSLNQYYLRFGAQRTERLDIEGHSLIYSRFEAYVVADSLICYNHNNIRQRISGAPNFAF